MYFLNITIVALYKIYLSRALIGDALHGAKTNLGFFTTMFLMSILTILNVPITLVVLSILALYTVLIQVFIHQKTWGSDKVNVFKENSANESAIQLGGMILFILCALMMVFFWVGIRWFS